ncbi:helix-turn-helix transcriptional regulator [Mesorhizobium sp.]|uniref:helix-turn-helix transcriptional regulator n=1 Tax=Mesorhizobium sp. TaxID=1871066 RepID=UPI000FE4F54C|nr:helix-turn-helix transcriptional regulator [Mesorhizobium sp.]RWM06980.1 MAG: LuxR family transcriptional regulator [Mesorhizobium sp.]
MHDTQEALRARQAIIRLAHTRSDSFALRQAVADRLRKHVPFDAFCWWTTDPATMFLTTSVAEWWEMPSAECVEIHRNEYLEPDFNKFRELARSRLPAATLAHATDGKPARSARYRRMMRPDGFEFELRASQAVDGACWGALALYRRGGSPAFERHEVEFVSKLGPHLAEGLRTSLLAAAIEDGKVSDAPGLLVLDGKGRLTAATAGAARWIDEIHGSIGRRPAEHRLSEAVWAVASLARSLDQDAGARLPRARVRTDEGEWLLVHAARMERDGEVAIIIERARPVQIASLLIRAYGLSDREADVVRAVLQGLSTEQIARTTYLSPYTVQDYLKSVFVKTGVRSRRELVGKLFAEQHWPQYGGGASELGADGWFAQTSRRLSNLGRPGNQAHIAPGAGELAARG